MRRTIGKVALFMMIEISSLWQIFLVRYVWQYEETYGAAHRSKGRIILTYGDTYLLYAGYSEF
jgi:hypothetical protein